MILDSKVSEVDIELREAEEELRLAAMERRKTEATWLRVMDAAGADAGWKAASGAQGSKAEVLSWRAWGCC